MTNGTKTIVIKNVPDQPIVYLNDVGVRGQRTIAPTPQITRQVRFAGKTIIVPGELRGRECSVAIYSLQGRLVKEFQAKSDRPLISVDNAAAAAMIARFTAK